MRRRLPHAGGVKGLHFHGVRQEVTRIRCVSKFGSTKLGAGFVGVLLYEIQRSLCLLYQLRPKLVESESLLLKQRNSAEGALQPRIPIYGTKNAMRNFEQKRHSWMERVTGRTRPRDAEKFKGATPKFIKLLLFLFIGLFGLLGIRLVPATASQGNVPLLTLLAAVGCVIAALVAIVRAK